MAGFVPIAVVPAEGTIVELELQKKSLLKNFTRTSTSAEPNDERKVVLKMQNLLPRT
jgi:hypothetical protein